MTNWQGKRILIIGAARQGLALARFLCKQGANVILNDKRPADQLKDEMEKLSLMDLEWVLGEHPLSLLDRVDMICLSGGVPLTLPIIAEAMKRNLPISNDSQIFMEAVSAPVIAITGSAGKTTTTTLMGRIANAAAKPGQKVWVGGNIGLPLVEYLDEIHSDDIVILELSSFQLELMTVSPHIAAVLNITPNHLDRHGTMQAYSAAKARILEFQSKADAAILDREDPGSWALRSLVSGKCLTFGLSKPTNNEDGVFFEEGMLKFQQNGKSSVIMSSSIIELRGQHNLLNVLAACAISIAAGFSSEAIQKGVAGFAGVEHRLEIVRKWNGVTWINDSIATAPERTMAALSSFDEPIILLLGGRDKNLPWNDLAAQVHQRVDHVIIFGEAADKIASAISTPKPGDRLTDVYKTNLFEDALEIAARVSQKEDVVLLSPGCTSYDAFRDFEERGNTFKKWVNQLS